SAAAETRTPSRRWSPRSSCKEDEPVLADLYLVVVGERRLLDAVPVQERAVEAPEILDREASALLGDDGMAARDGHVVEEDVAVGGAADRRPLTLELEDLTGAAAAGTDDQCRAFDALDAGTGIVRQAFRRVAQRRLGLARLALEHRTAAGAVVRG